MFNTINFRPAAMVSTLGLFVSGCSGTIIPLVLPGTPPPAGYYEDLDSSAAKTSDLGGVGIRNNSEIARGTGSITHDTGSTSYEDSNYSFTDDDGADVNGLFADGLGSTIASSNGVFVEGFTGTYEYVMPITFNYTVGDVPYVTNGFAGLVTNPTHVPVGGGADYAGEVTGLAITSDDLFDLVGVSLVSVDFEAGKVHATFNEFTATVESGGDTTPPFDTVVITGMTIAGNTFSGGDLATFLSGDPITVIGDTLSYSSEGSFFGWDYANVTPDEIAGVSVTQGSDGWLLFSFIGD